MDKAMKHYVESKEYLEEQREINLQIELIERNSIPEMIPEIRKLEDMISLSGSKYAQEAFKQAVKWAKI